jgi:hypothetical protein
MKNKLKELDVDVIGGLGPLTKEEQQRISEYIKSQKLLKTKKTPPNAQTSKRAKVTAG